MLRVKRMNPSVYKEYGFVFYENKYYIYYENTVMRIILLVYAEKLEVTEFETNFLYGFECSYTCLWKIIIIRFVKNEGKKERMKDERVYL